MKWCGVTSAQTAAFKILHPDIYTYKIPDLKAIVKKGKYGPVTGKSKQDLYNLLGLGLVKTNAERKREARAEKRSAQEAQRSILMIDRGNDIIEEIDLNDVVLAGYNEGSHIPAGVWSEFSCSDAANEKIQKIGQKGANCPWRSGETTGEPLAVKKNGKTTYAGNLKDVGAQGRFLNICKAVQVIKAEFPHLTERVPVLNDWRDLRPEHIDLFYNKKIGRCVLKGEEIDRKTTSTLKHFYVWICQQRALQLL
tara:strand:+ start:2058 stop:2813 length:756 start_codon:yes stop_codon:yes gene_type:complete